MSVEQDSEQVEGELQGSYEQDFLSVIKDARRAEHGMADRRNGFDEDIARRQAQRDKIEDMRAGYEALVVGSYLDERQRLFDALRQLHADDDITEYAHRAAFLSPENMLHDTEEHQTARKDITDALLSIGDGEPVIVLPSLQDGLPLLKAGVVRNRPWLEMDSKQRLSLHRTLGSTFQRPLGEARFYFDEMVTTGSDGQLKCGQDMIIGKEAIGAWLKGRLIADTIDDQTEYGEYMADQDAMVTEICAQVGMTLQDCDVSQQAINKLKEMIHQRITTYGTESSPPKHVFRALIGLDDTPREEIYGELRDKLAASSDGRVKERINDVHKVCFG